MDSTASLVSIIDSYIRYYAQGSSHTARAKRLDLNHFLSFLTRLEGYSKKEKLKVADWSFISTEKFIEHRLTKGESPATVARRLATLKHMGRTFAEKFPGFINPAKDCKTPKVQAPTPKALSRQDLDEVRKNAKERLSKKGSFIRARNLFLFEFLIDTGIRADEIRLLRMNQLDEQLEWIKNVRTKGRRYRNVYITSTAQPILQEYLELRAKQLDKHFSKLTKKTDLKLPLFISTYNASVENLDSFLMGSKTIWRAMRELSHGTKLHPHLLRHSFAVDLLESSKDIRLVSQALGHGDVRTTMRYTQRDEVQVAQALEISRKVKK